MNTQSVQGRYVAMGEIEQVGDFTYDETCTHIYFWLPGQKGPDCCQIHKGPGGGPRVWGWDGNVAAPTLTPSILVHAGWHGWLQAGQFKSC